MVRTILYVDDESALCRAFERALRSPEMRVITTTSAPRAVELMDSERFDVVATDYRMPEINGIEVLRLARHKAPGARRLLVSGRIEGEVEPQILDEADIDHVLLKPWTLEELRRVVRRAAEFASLTRENAQLSLALQTKLQQAADERRAKELRLLLGALELRDPLTAEHSRRTARVARALAEKLGLGGDELAAVEDGALLHDVGKLGLGDDLLHKSLDLTAVEWSQRAQHPHIGARLIEGFDLLPGTAAIIRQHHERVDGTGYPFQLRGQEITLAARIVAVADAYDTMRHDKPYRAARSPEAALRELEANAGTQFDRLVVDAFMHLDLSL